MKKYIAPIAAHSYFLLTILGIVLFFFPQGALGLEFLEILGCHTVFYSLAAILQAESRTFAIFCLVFWCVYIIAFIICYLFAAVKRKYLPIAMIALIDVLFSAFFTCRAISYVGFLIGHIPMLTGIAASALTCICLFYAHRNQGISDCKTT